MGSIRVVAFGVAAIIFSCVALQMSTFSRFLNWLGVVSGVLTFGFLITPLAVLGYLAYFLIAIWAIWLGAVLSRELVSARAEAPAPAA
jgi:sorbitol-specific phosphotransferase system component IIC